MIYIIVVVGLILRLISLNQSLWLDEATTAMVSKMSLTDIFTKFLPNDFHPPFYYLLMKYWVIVFGSSEISLRIPSIVFGLATIYVVYKISKNYIAPLLVSTSGLLIYYSQEARMYSLATLLVSLAIYFYTKNKWVIFSILLLLIGMTDYVALFVIPVFLISDIKNWKKILLSLAPLIIGFMVWLPIFIKQISSGVNIQGSAWWNILGTGTFKNILLIPAKFIFGRIHVYPIVVILIFCLFSYVLYRALRESKLIWIWLILPILIGIFISFKIPTLTYFRYLFCLPAFYILISKSKVSIIFVYLVLLINILSTGYYLLIPRFHREDWRGLANSLGTQKIIFPSSSQKEALTYYGKSDQIIRLDQISKTEKEIWLSRYVWEIVDPTDATRLKLENLGYNRTSEENFNGVLVFKYTK